jgi:hypothetical protein
MLLLYLWDKNGKERLNGISSGGFIGLSWEVFAYIAAFLFIEELLDSESEMMVLLETIVF